MVFIGSCGSGAIGMLTPFLNRVLIVILLIFPTFFGCQTKLKITSPGNFNHAGMKLIPAAGMSFLQGSSDSLASSDEKPQMPVEFSYDYWLDTIEVTQKSYFDLMGKNPVSGAVTTGTGDGFPVYNVSWFDAALYCNARSKRDGLDTVYVYFGKKVMQSGSVYELTGLRTSLEKTGYRLPTESEWEYADRSDAFLSFAGQTDTSLLDRTAWYSFNSGGMAHKSGLLKQNSFGMQDMAGNVFEWTNDWKGPYSTKNIRNSLGAPYPNPDFEKVVKGGSYKHGQMFLRPSCRSATYATTLSSCCDYVGFRCACGPISGGAYINAAQQNLSMPSIDLLASDMGGFLGTNNARLVFVNVYQGKNSFCFVDFNTSHPFITEISDTLNMCSPAISPNGKFVAYSTQGPGFTGISSVYIRCLDSMSIAPVCIVPDHAFVPRWWVNKATGDTVLIYANSSIDNSLAEWKGTQTFSQRMSGGRPVGLPDVLIPDGGFYDGLSADGRYAVTGLTRLLMHDLILDSTKQLFLSPLNGKGPEGSSQVCNVSISPDLQYTSRCLFLDFGYSRVSSLTNCSYGPHEFIFMTDWSGRALRWYHCPSGEGSWDYPQWSPAPNCAVSASRTIGENAHSIWFINLKDSLYLNVVNGTELRYPALWVSSSASVPADSLNPDSLGIYNVPFITPNQNQFCNRMRGFWNKHDSMRVIFLGTSHTIFSVDPRFFIKTSGLVCNMATEQGSIWKSVEIIKGYILNHCPTVKLIGFEVIPGLVRIPREGADPGILGSKGFMYDKNHHFWAQGQPDGFLGALNLIPLPIIPGLVDTLGLLAQPTNGWGGPNPDLQLFYNCDSNNTALRSNLATLDTLAQNCSALGIHVLFFITPESPYYKGLGYSGRYGPDLTTGNWIVTHFDGLSRTNPLIHLYDAHKGGDHDYGNEDAFDQDHLSEHGAQKFSTRIDSLVHALID
jgi:uncharacterized protein (TIGR02171 family)